MSFLVPKVPSNRSCCCALPPLLKCRTTFRAETCKSTDIWIGQRQLVNILILTNQSKVPEGAQATSKKQLQWSQTARDFGGVGLFWGSRSLEMKDSRGLTLNMTGYAQMQAPNVFHCSSRLRRVVFSIATKRRGVGFRNVKLAAGQPSTYHSFKARHKPNYQQDTTTGLHLPTTFVFCKSQVISGNHIMGGPL